MKTFHSKSLIWNLKYARKWIYKDIWYLWSSDHSFGSPFQEHFTEMKVCQGEETIKIVSAGNESMIRYGNSLKEGTDKYGLIHTSAYGSTIITKWIKSK